MIGIIKGIKRLFGRFDTGYEYWIDRENIHVNPDWRKTRIGNAKFKHKMWYWLHTGEFESKIILDNGYSSLRIAEIKDIRKVPVYFVD